MDDESVQDEPGNELSCGAQEGHSTMLVGRRFVFFCTV